jgi:voltage-gated potassium channel
LVIVNFPNLSKVTRTVDELRHVNALGPTLDIVLVDADLEELPPELERRHVHFVRGCPSRDETLTRADIDDASRAVILAKRPGESSSDNENLANLLAIEARKPSVRTVVECVDEGTIELLHKAGCDNVVCSSRFDVHFLGSEMVNSGTQEVIDELLDAMTGEQLFFTPFDGPATTFGVLAERCRQLEHIAIGVRSGKRPKLRPAASHKVESGDAVISIGASKFSLGAKR